MDPNKWHFHSPVQAAWRNWDPAGWVLLTKQLAARIPLGSGVNETPSGKRVLLADTECHFGLEGLLHDNDVALL